MPIGKHDPEWPDLLAQWKRTQEDLRARIIIQPLDPLPRFVAGVDAAFSADKQRVFAAAVIYDRQEQRTIDLAHAVLGVNVPYIPGFLSFREGPAILAAIGNLKHPFGVVCFDGQGYAHPRRCGLASHMAVTLDLPGVGVAKSRFIGEFVDPPPKTGAFSPLLDQEEQIGIVLRTQAATRPLFVSIGHKVDLESARRLVLACCTRYRIPEPTRHADIEVAKLKECG